MLVKGESVMLHKIVVKGDMDMMEIIHVCKSVLKGTLLIHNKNFVFIFALKIDMLIYKSGNVCNNVIQLMELDIMQVI